MDAVCGEVLEPRSGAFCEVERKVLDDEDVIIRPSCSKGKAEVYQPYSGVGVLGVFGIVRRCAEPCRERRLADLLREHLWAASVQARAASRISNPRMSAVIVRVAVTVV